MIHVNIDPKSIQFEASAILAELACRVLIGKINSGRPVEDAPTSAIRTAIRSDFASAIGLALKEEETAARNRAVLIERMSDTGLDVVGSQIKTERVQGETDAEYRVRLEVANSIELPLHKVLRVAAEAMVGELLEDEAVSKILVNLAGTYGVE